MDGVTHTADRPATLPAPAAFPVSIVLERRPLRHGRWTVDSWQAVAAVAGERVAAGRVGPTELRGDGEIRRYLWSGLSVRLERGAAESYWHNLVSDRPVLCVICQHDEAGMPHPVTVTPDHDLACAHMEGDDPVFSVPMPPEIYQWLERFVVEHYRPAPRKQRKRKHWSEEEHDERATPRARRPAG